MKKSTPRSSDIDVQVESEVWEFTWEEIGKHFLKFVKLSDFLSLDSRIQ